MANQFLSLALFLMLLSFFIIMNGMSDFEESKARSALNSIALAFSNEAAGEMKASFDEPNPSAAINKGDTLESIEGLFNAHIAGFEVARNRLGTTMHVRTSVGQFENAINTLDIDYDDASLGMKGSFLLTMVTLLRSEGKGQPYRIDMILNLPDDSSVFQKQYPEEFLKSLKRVSGFAKVMEEAGLPKKMISAGLAKGKSSMIDLYIYRYKSFNIPSLINNNMYKNGEP